MNLISDCMKIANRVNKPPAALTARTKRMTADHSWRKCRGFFFGGAACCTLLDDTWNTGMTLFLCDTILTHLHDYLIISILGKVQFGRIVRDSLNRHPVSRLREAKGLSRSAARSFATLRMTGLDL